MRHVTRAVIALAAACPLYGCAGRVTPVEVGLSARDPDTLALIRALADVSLFDHGYSPTSSDKAFAPLRMVEEFGARVLSVNGVPVGHELVEANAFRELVARGPVLEAMDPVDVLSALRRAWALEEALPPPRHCHDESGGYSMFCAVLRRVGGSAEVRDMFRRHAARVGVQGTAMILHVLRDYAPPDERSTKWRERETAGYLRDTRTAFHTCDGAVQGQRICDQAAALILYLREEPGLAPDAAERHRQVEELIKSFDKGE